MKSVFEHIETIKQKPHHVRKHVAYGLAGVGTAIIGFIWLTASLSAGAFALGDSSFAKSTNQESVTVRESGDRPSAIAGAAAALPKTDSTKVRIEVVSSSPSVSVPHEQTTLPF